MKINLKNPVHYTLSWIACIDDYYKMYKMPKVKNNRFLKRMDWKGKKQYRNAKFIYSWHLILEQILGELIIELGRFLTKICLRG